MSRKKSWSRKCRVLKFRTGMAAAVTACVMAAVPAMTVWADGTELSETPVRIESMGMEISVPEGWITITSEMAEDDPAFTENEMDGEKILKKYREHGILIDSINKAEKVEFNIVLSGEDQEIVHLTQFSQADIKTFADDLITPKEGGIESVNIHDYVIYDHPQAKFIAGEADLNGAANGEQYYTIVNGSRLCFQMFSFDGELSKENKAMLRSMVDSVHFDSLQEAGPLLINQSRSSWLDQFAPKYLVRNVIIFSALGIAWYYISKALKKKKK